MPIGCGWWQRPPCYSRKSQTKRSTKYERKLWIQFHSFLEIPCMNGYKRSWTFSKRISLRTKTRMSSLQGNNGEHRALNALCILHDLVPTIPQERTEGNGGNRSVLYVTGSASDTRIICTNKIESNILVCLPYSSNLTYFDKLLSQLSTLGLLYLIFG